MSLRLVADALDYAPYDGGTLLVLMALASWANDEGDRIYPKIETLAAKARLSKRATQYALRKLEVDGVLTVVSGGSGRHTTEYRLEVQKMHLWTQDVGEQNEGCKICTSDAAPAGGAKRADEGCKTCTAEVQKATGQRCNDCTSGVQSATSHIDNPVSEPVMEPVTLTRAAARGSVCDLKSKPKGEPDRNRPSRHASARQHWQAFWAVWTSLPGFSPQMSPARAEMAFGQVLTDHPDLEPSALTAAAEAYRAYLVRTNAARRRDHVRGEVLIPYPERWLSEGMWKAFAASKSPETRPDAGVSLAKAVQGLGVEGLRRLRAAGLTDAEIREWFSGAEGVEGDPPKICIPSRFRARYAEDRFLPRLRRADAFGPDIEIVFTEIKGVLE